MKEAPLFVHAYDLHSWLLDRLRESPGDFRVCDTVLRHSQAILEAVSLALARFDTEERLIEADRHVVLLRLHLRLAGDKEILSRRQIFFCTERLRGIGRQIGGWRRQLRSAPPGR